MRHELVGREGWSLSGEGQGDADVDIRTESATLNEDDRELEALGYVPSFKREFTNLATVNINWIRINLVLILLL